MEKLEKKDVENIMSLTGMQQSMLLNYVEDEYSKAYHEQLSLTIAGEVHAEFLEKAWNFVIKNNELLRTVFRWESIERPVQIVKKNHEIKVQYFDLTNEPDKDKALENIKSEDLNYRIDITKETLRIYLCKLHSGKYEMIISNHHIIYDGWSSGIILNELFEAYSGFYHGRLPKLLTKTKFSEFVKYLKSLDKQEQREYWSNYFNIYGEADCCFQGKGTGEFAVVRYKLDNEISNKIKEFAKSNRLSLAALLYAAYGILMHKLAGSQKVIFGTVVSGRTEKIRAIESMVGLFINVIPMIVNCPDNMLLIDLIRDIEKTLSERKSFENTSLSDIKEYCGLNTYEELFNSVVTIENYPLNINANSDLAIERFSIFDQGSYNMNLQIFTFEGIEFKFDFNTLFIEEAVVKGLAQDLENIMCSLSDNRDMRVSEVELLCEKRC